MALVRPPEAIPLLDAGVERSRVERSKLRRELGRLDAVCLLIAAIVVMDTLGAVARGGAQTVTWLAIVAALFFVPAGLVIAELGAAFPHQGGPYVWARLAFGGYAGSLVALRPMRGLKQDRSARVIIAGHALVQNLRRGHYELAVEVPVGQRLTVAFDHLALAI